jgi:hypothetical protein
MNKVMISDLSGMIDFNLINDQFNQLTFTNNVQNLISTDTKFFSKDVFIDTKFSVERECKNYLTQFYGMQDFFTDLVITDSWGNITKAGQGHHEHLHPFSVVSGIIFLDNTPDNLNLYIEAYQPEIPYFISKNKSYIALKNILPEMGINAIEHNFLKNHLILFLSNSNHFVEKTSEQSPNRRTISFNTFWKGKTGFKDSPLGSHIF